MIVSSGETNHWRSGFISIGSLSVFEPFKFHTILIISYQQYADPFTGQTLSPSLPNRFLRSHDLLEPKADIASSPSSSCASNTKLSVLAAVKLLSWLSFLTAADCVAKGCFSPTTTA